MKAVIKLSSMGDVIHSLVVLPKLNEKIDFVVDESFEEIVNHNPFVDKIVSVPLRKAKKQKGLFFKEYKRLKKLNYEEVYDLQGLLKSAAVGKLISKKLIGYENPREKIASFFYDEKRRTDSKVAIKRYMDLFGFEDDEYLVNHPKLLYYEDREFDFLSKSQKNIIFIIGASWECKKTPLNVWKELALFYKNENIIIPVSSKSEEEDAKEIKKINKNAHIVKLNLNDLKALISKSDLLIGNDTGPSFIAWANNVPNVILYGCTYNNKILENRYSKSVEIQRGSIDKKLNNMHKMSVKEIIKAVDGF